MSEFILPQQTGDEVDLLRQSALFQNVKIVNAKAMEQASKIAGKLNIDLPKAPYDINNPYSGRIQPETNEQQERNPYEGQSGIIRNYAPDDPIGISQLGTAVYSDLSFMGCSYTDNLTGRTITLPNNATQQTATNRVLLALNTVIITVDQPIRIVRTEIQGRDGSVKEYIGKDDMKININGIITGKNGVHPKDTVKLLKQWLDAPVSKGVISWWLNNMGVTNLTVESYSFPQIAGGYSYQTFVINAISDAPVELRIITPAQ